MTWLQLVLRKMMGLFIEDPTLAAGIAVWIALIALLGPVPGLALARALALAIGLSAILGISIARGSSRA